MSCGVKFYHFIFCYPVSFSFVTEMFKLYIYMYFLHLSSSFFFFSLFLKFTMWRRTFGHYSSGLLKPMSAMLLSGRDKSSEARVPTRSETRRHRKLFSLTVREEREEGLRDFLPEKPLLPAGWNFKHNPGSNMFEMTKEIEVRGCGVEHLHVIALMERKQYESTYRMDNGERNEQEYLNFVLFLNKNRYEKGGLEFGLTSIDMELVMDSVAIHDTKEKFEASKQSWYESKKTHQLPTNLALRRYRDGFYRGPMLNELDDDLSDEMIDYLDERGINDAFADFMMSQAYYLEQEEYLNWLRLLRRFSD